MRHRANAWTLALAALSLYLTSALPAAEAPRIEKETLKAQLGTEVIIIDVRAFTDWLFTKDKIKGAVRENPKDSEEWIGKYPKDKAIVLYCA
jgi:rhodanese-related sulfurtransferase